MKTPAFRIRPLAVEVPDAVWFHAVSTTNRLDLLGWARVEHGDDERWWFAIHVCSPARGGGIGTELLASACAWADICRHVMHLTSKPRLVRWYESAGFKRCKPWKGFKMAAGQTLMVRKPEEWPRPDWTPFEED
jgi:GNAT superfamily N-acetyltransferase